MTVYRPAAPGVLRHDYRRVIDLESPYTASAADGVAAASVVLHITAAEHYRPGLPPAPVEKMQQSWPTIHLLGNIGTAVLPSQPEAIPGNTFHKADENPERSGARVTDPLSYVKSQVIRIVERIE